MLTLLRLQHRRLLAVWLTMVAFIVLQLACGCGASLPSGLPASVLLTMSSRLFVLSLIPVAVVFALIRFAPVLRGIVDPVLPVVLFLPLTQIAQDAVGLSSRAADVAELALLLLLCALLGFPGFGRRLWFS